VAAKQRLDCMRIIIDRLYVMKIWYCWMSWLRHLVMFMTLGGCRTPVCLQANIRLHNDTQWLGDGAYVHIRSRSKYFTIYCYCVRRHCHGILSRDFPRCQIGCVAHLVSVWCLGLLWIIVRSYTKYFLGLSMCFFFVRCQCYVRIFAVFSWVFPEVSEVVLIFSN